VAGAFAVSRYDPRKLHTAAPASRVGDLTRRRERFNGAGSAEKNRVQKVLEDANVKLGNVLTDAFGTSGQLMLDDS
jgi:hypothetical protein